MGARTMIAAGAAVAAALVAAQRRAERRAAERFYEWSSETDVWWDVDGVRSRAPGYVNRLEVFGSVHAADATACARLLPSDALALLRLPDGHAAVFVAGLHYRELTVRGFTGALSPYGEVIVALLVTRVGAPPLLPLLGLGPPVPAGWRPGMLYLAIPVTHRWTRDAGWTMGFPKFVADLDFEDAPTSRRVRVSEANKRILELTVPVGGATRRVSQPMLGFTVNDGRLFEVDTLALAYQQVGIGGRGVVLELGDHQVAARMRDLGVSSRAFASLVWPAGRVIMPPPRPIGPARAMEAYRGSDHWFGRYTIRYPGTDPVDQYAGLTRAGIERAIVRGGGRVLEEYESMDADLEQASRAPGSVRMEEDAARARDHELVATRIVD